MLSYSTSFPLSPHVISCIRDFLVAHTPSWHMFNIVRTAEYLGVWIGPAAPPKQWSNVDSDYIKRVDAIAAANVASSLAVRTHNSKGINKYSYLSQFLPPPPYIRRLEKYAVTQLFKITYDTLSHDECFAISQIGMETIRSLD